MIDTALQHRLLIPDPEGAAALIVQKADLEAGARAAFEALRAERRVWMERGRDLGLPLDPEVAIVRARLVLNRANGPHERGIALNDLGISLAERGERETDPARLEAAAVAFRAALEKLTRDRAPLAWAMTQNNLGNALWTLGARNEGTARLAQAVAAYRAALEERTRDRVPTDWAITQNSFAGALLARFDRAGDPADLDAAAEAAQGARAVFAEVGAGQYLAQAEARLAAIAARRAR